jgi:hypothetical protein
VAFKRRKRQPEGFLLREGAEVEVLPRPEFPEERLPMRVRKVLATSYALEPRAGGNMPPPAVVRDQEVLLVCHQEDGEALTLQCRVVNLLWDARSRVLEVEQGAPADRAEVAQAPPDSTSSERRKHFRIPMDRPAICRMVRGTTIGTEIPVRVRNLSLDGMMFEAREPLREGTPVEIRLRSLDFHLEVQARVIHSTRLSDGRHAIGVLFTEISPVNREVLTYLVTSGLGH